MQPDGLKILILLRNLWPNIVKVVKHWEGLCKSSRPKNKSYETLVKYYSNKLVPIRLQFFQDIANQLHGYLEIFQTDRPTVPFLSDSLECLLRNLMKMIVMEGTTTSAAFKLVKLDLSNNENLISPELLKLPTGTKGLLNTLKEDRKRQFKKDCRIIIITLIKKLQERCPLAYQLARSASSLSPLDMVRNKAKCSTQFISLVDKLYSGKWISSVAADEVKKEYDLLLDATQQEHKDAFLTFDYRKESVDKFLATFVHGNTRYKNCWNICKLIFTLSHGQASVERGFSVNKELLVENLQKVSLVSQRIVYDYFFSTKKRFLNFRYQMN